MADPTVFQITDGYLALKIVNLAEVGYLTTWKAPGGKTATTAVLADYDTGSTVWSCQVTSAQLTASANANDVEVPATFCAAARTIPQPGQTSFELEAEFLQDIDISTGLSKFLFENDTLEAYFLLALSGVTNAPRAIGRLRLLAGAFGGAPRENLTASVSLPLSSKPSIKFGNVTTNVIVGAFGAPIPEGAFDPSAHSVAEVKDYLEANPDERSVVLAAESAGRSRASLTAESMATD